MKNCLVLFLVSTITFANDAWRHDDGRVRRDKPKSVKIESQKGTNTVSRLVTGRNLGTNVLARAGWRPVTVTRVAEVTNVPREVFALEQRIDNLASAELPPRQVNRLSPEDRYLSGYQSLFSTAAGTNRVQGVKAIKKMRRIENMVNRADGQDGGPLHPLYLQPTIAQTNQVRRIIPRKIPIRTPRSALRN